MRISINPAQTSHGRERTGGLLLKFLRPSFLYLCSIFRSCRAGVGNLRSPSLPTRRGAKDSLQSRIRENALIPTIAYHRIGLKFKVFPGKMFRQVKTMVWGVIFFVIGGGEVQDCNRSEFDTQSADPPLWGFLRRKVSGEFLLLCGKWYHNLDETFPRRNRSRQILQCSRR